MSVRNVTDLTLACEGVPPDKRRRKLHRAASRPEEAAEATASKTLEVVKACDFHPRELADPARRIAAEKKVAHALLSQPELPLQLADRAAWEFNNGLTEIFKSSHIYPLDKPFPISRSGIELFLECPACFVFLYRYGIHRPWSYPYTLNNLLDREMKDYFDRFTMDKGEVPPCFKELNLELYTLDPEKTKGWRNNFSGISCIDEKRGLKIFGAIDVAFEDKEGLLHFGDFKGTSTAGEPKITDKADYGHQADIYLWIAKKMGLNISPRFLFIYQNGKPTHGFDGTLHFEGKVIAYDSGLLRDDPFWVDLALDDMVLTLKGEKEAKPNPACRFCHHDRAVELVRAGKSPGEFFAAMQNKA